MNFTIPSSLLKEIGEYIGLELEDTDRVGFVAPDCHFYKGFWLLSYFCPAEWRSHYTLNLKTLRPTRGSLIQKELSSELKKKLKEACKNIPYPIPLTPKLLVQSFGPSERQPQPASSTSPD